MFLAKQTLLKHITIQLFLFLNLGLLASECNTPPPTPPLPPTSAGPALRIALLTPNTGELATFGRLLRNGSLMAFDAWGNQAGGSAHPIEWVIYDTACDFETAGQAARQAIDDGIQFIIGPLCSDAAIAAAAEAESAKILMISPTATQPLVTVNPQGHTRATVFKVSHSYPAHGQAAARFASEQLQTREAAVFFDPNDAYSSELVKAFTQQFEQQGGEIVYQATYTLDDTNFSEHLLAIRKSKAEVLYLPAPVDIVNRLADQMNQLYVGDNSPSLENEPILLGSDSWDSPELDLAAVTGSYFTTNFTLTGSNPAAQQWVEAYQATYAIEPDTLAGLGYEATQLLLTAIQQTGSFSPTEVAKTLEQSNFNGITGQVSFDNQHNPLQPVPMLHVEAGQLSRIP